MGHARFENGKTIMNYLQPSEYEVYGLESTTALAWVTAASAIIDAHCRRATLAVAQYTERLRTENGQRPVRLTYLPLVGGGAGDIADCVGAGAVCDAATGRVASTRTMVVGCGARIRNSRERGWT